MPHHLPLITTFVTALVLAFLLGGLAARFKTSPIVGYLIAGILVGPYTPGFVADISLAQQLAEVGVILLMFGVGLHFSIEKLLEVRGISLPGALVQTTVATGLGTGLGLMMGWTLEAGIVLGMCLSVASTVVLLRGLEENNLLETKRGQIAVGWLIIEDLITIFALVMLPVLASTLGDTPPHITVPIESDGVLWTLAVTFAKVGLFILIMLLVGPRVIPWVLDRVALTGSRELFTLAVLAIAMGIAFAAAELANASFALGAFFAGIVMATSRLSQNAAERSLPLRDAFAVIFFVSVGMLFDPKIVVTHTLPLLGVLFIILIGKSIAAFLIVRLFGYSSLTAATVAVSLAQVGEFSFILSSFAMQLEMLPRTGNDLILAGAIITIMLNPLLFWVVGRYESQIEQFWPVPPRPDDVLATPVALDLRDHVIVVGYGRVGQRITEDLNEQGVPLVLIEPNRDRIDFEEDGDRRVIYGPADRRSVLLAAGVRKARALMVAIPRAFDAAHIVEQARSLRPDLEIIARANFEAEAELLTNSGAQKVLIAEQVLADQMVAALDVDVFAPNRENESENESEEPAPAAS